MQDSIIFATASLLRDLAATLGSPASSRGASELRHGALAAPADESSPALWRSLFVRESLPCQVSEIKNSKKKLLVASHGSRFF